MQIVTKNENKILLLINNNLDSYPTGMSFDTIREFLDLSETEVFDLLESLEKKNFIGINLNSKTITYDDLDQEFKVVEDKSELEKYMLNKTEQDAYEIIRDVIEEYRGYAPRYIIEGALLYGDLELSPKRTYNIVVSLENQKLLNKVMRADGEYYTI